MEETAIGHSLSMSTLPSRASARALRKVHGKVTRASSAGHVTRVAMRTSTVKLLMMAVAGGASREALRSSASLERRLAAILSTGSALSHLALGGVRLALRP